MYVEHLVEVFRDVRRVLRPEGTVWLNLGDTYATGAGKVGEHPGGGEQGDRWKGNSDTDTAADSGKEAGRIAAMGPMTQPNRMPVPVLKRKDLAGIPWRVAFALQADGWWLRRDIVWNKRNPKPESVRDRPTSAHEYVFLLTKAERYFYDDVAVREEGKDFKISTDDSGFRSTRYRDRADLDNSTEVISDITARPIMQGSRNRHSVWTIATKPLRKAHFATFPKKLVEPCVLAGTSEVGCCAECGAPYSRIIDQKQLLDGAATVGTWSRHDERGLQASHRIGPQGIGHCRFQTSVVTLGWMAECNCWTGAPVPCTFLDPFCGSGTAGLVALRLGRNFVGIEASPEYCEMARDRIKSDAPLFNIEKPPTTRRESMGSRLVRR